MNRPTSPRDGPRTSPAPPTETIDAKRCKECLAFPAPLLARPSRMVRRCRLRTLPSFARHAGRLLSCAFSGGVLRRAAQPPLFTPQPLLLKLFSCRCVPILISKFLIDSLQWQSLTGRLTLFPVGPFTLRYSDE